MGTFLIISEQIWYNNRGWPLMEEDIWWKMTFNGRLLIRENSRLCSAICRRCGHFTCTNLEHLIKKWHLSKIFPLLDPYVYPLIKWDSNKYARTSIIVSSFFFSFFLRSIYRQTFNKRFGVELIHSKFLQVTLLIVICFYYECFY